MNITKDMKILCETPEEKLDLINLLISEGLDVEGSFTQPDYEPNMEYPLALHSYDSWGFSGTLGYTHMASDIIDYFNDSPFYRKVQLP